MIPSRCIGVVLLVLAAWSPAAGQSTQRVTLDALGNQFSENFWHVAISADGRCVAFDRIFYVGTGGTIEVSDTWWKDSVTGQLLRIDLGNGSGNSYFPSLSADGHLVAFQSAADNLGVPNPQHIPHSFVRDVTASTTTCLDVDGSGHSSDGSVTPQISGDGRYATFASKADYLVAGDVPGTWDVFRLDRQTWTFECASLTPTGGFGNGTSQYPSISADGRYVVFMSSATNLVAGDTNGVDDVFVRDFVLGTTTRVSVDSAGAQAPQASGYPSFDTRPRISGDGRIATFTSLAKFASDDKDAFQDVYYHDLSTGTTDLVGRDSSGVRGWAGAASPSGDGRFLSFPGGETLVPGDTNVETDIFVRDLSTGITTRASLGDSGQQGNGPCYDSAISADGRYVAFVTQSDNLVAGDTNGKTDVYLRDRAPAAATVLCVGDGTGTPCPCANSGGPNRGCQNSATTGGAVLAAVGAASLGADTLHITSYGERPTAFSVLIQGSLSVGPLNYGDGLRCVGGTLKRLYTRSATMGVFGGPEGADLPISARSAALGDTIPAGGTRIYQVQYRDPAPGFCPIPMGNTWNASTALSVLWNP
jgi:Tol biopolymer transport system component